MRNSLHYGIDLISHPCPTREQQEENRPVQCYRTLSVKTLSDRVKGAGPCVTVNDVRGSYGELNGAVAVVALRRKHLATSAKYPSQGG
jgi:hypothetical protein